MLYDRRSVEFRLLSLRYNKELAYRLGTARVEHRTRMGILLAAASAINEEGLNSALDDTAQQRNDLVSLMNYGTDRSGSKKTKTMTNEQKRAYLESLAGDRQKFRSIGEVISKINTFTAQLNQSLNSDTQEQE